MALSTAAAIAANRFGLGARPGDLARIDRDPRGWLSGQVGRAPVLRGAGLQASAAIARRFVAFREERRKARQGGGAGPKFGEIFVPIYQQEVLARFHRSVTTEAPFAERLAQFWSNHFAVSSLKNQVLPVAGAFEREAIRPHVFGRFGDMLAAVVRHPAMLVYLDNIQSIGPNSTAGKRRDAGLNENLAREILELHTVGVDGGYSQADVTAFARVLTGWTVSLGRRMPGRTGEFVFVKQMHEPGAQTVLGRRYDQGGMAQGEAVLADLARHPATARFVASKLVRHFVADAPPAAAVDHIAAVFLDSGGDLAAVSRALVALPAAWDPPLAKFKTPTEFMVSGLRAFGVKDAPDDGILGSLLVMGQPTFGVPSPEGWPDTTADWAAPDSVLRRAEWAMAFGERVGDAADPLQIADLALGPVLSRETQNAVTAAASRAQGITLLLASPEFQRR